ncbi:unnamed protein product [Mytilus edulis]|uniref:Apple domain-containing protein n=1 Tax=Mytilus edulis TaxID=6550 RepID=A0A8S3R1P8_MYTED|nr:unnamed protein product [Mytilus edulis]
MAIILCVASKLDIVICNFGGAGLGLPDQDSVQAQPVTENTQPHLVTDQRQTQPVTEQGQTQPVTEKSQTQPVTDKTQTQSVTDKTQTQSVTDKTQTQSVTDKTQTQSVTDKTQTQSVTEKIQTQDVSTAVTESASNQDIIKLDTTVQPSMLSSPIGQNLQWSIYDLAWPNIKLKPSVSQLYTGNSTNVVDCAVLCFRNSLCTSFTYNKQYCYLYQSFNVDDVDAVAVASKLNLTSQGFDGDSNPSLPSGGDPPPAPDPIPAPTIKTETQTKDASKVVTESAVTSNIPALDTTVSNTLKSPTIALNSQMYILDWPNIKLKSYVDSLYTGSATTEVACAILCFRNSFCTSFTYKIQYCCLYQSFNVGDVDAVIGYNTFVKINI